jgi:hypothetical protein
MGLIRLLCLLGAGKPDPAVIGPLAAETETAYQSSTRTEELLAAAEALHFNAGKRNLVRVVDAAVQVFALDAAKLPRLFALRTAYGAGSLAQNPEGELRDSLSGEDDWKRTLAAEDPDVLWAETVKLLGETRDDVSTRLGEFETFIGSLLAKVKSAHDGAGTTVRGATRREATRIELEQLQNKVERFQSDATRSRERLGVIASDPLAT